jgi:hypothetical protein
MKDVINQESVFVCYGKLNPTTIFGYKYVILEAFFYSELDIQEFKKNNELVFAYISLGEINSYSKWYKELKPFTVGMNQNWKSLLLNLENHETITVLKNEIKTLIQKGYSGVFFDNLDNFGAYGQQTNQQQYLIQFIKEISQNYPKHQFIQNSGLEFIASTHKYVAAILLESMASSYDFDKCEYQIKSQNEFIVNQEKIKTLTEHYKIPVLVVDYADSKEKYTAIKKKLQHCDVSFFVGKIDLQTIPNFN